jgi:hypothetical protein
MTEKPLSPYCCQTCGNCELRNIIGVLCSADFGDGKKHLVEDWHVIFLEKFGCARHPALATTIEGRKFYEQAIREDEREKIIGAIVLDLLKTKLGLVEELQKSFWHRFSGHDHTAIVAIDYAVAIAKSHRVDLKEEEKNDVRAN